MEIKVEKLIESPNLREKVYEVLKGIIVFNDIKPGDKIDEEGLAKKLGVSRTPIRECLCRLENEGLVEVVPRRGAFVVKHSKNRILELLLVREVLEGLAARLAAENMDEKKTKELKALFKNFSESTVQDQSKSYTDADLEFHTFILNESGNNLLTNFMNILNGHIHMLRPRTVTLRGRAESSLQEHLRIIEAFEKKDPPLAEALMKEHIKNLRGDFLKGIEEDLSNE